jgi:hypothetical protein
VDGTLVADQDGKAKAGDAFYERLLGSSHDRGFSLDLDYLGMQSRDLACGVGGTLLGRGGVELHQVS